MKRTSILAIGGAALALLPAAGASTAMAGASTAFELEHARANARAGGPISEYDAELLERWGNSTGGPDWRKIYRAQQGYRDGPPRALRYKKKPGVYRDY